MAKKATKGGPPSVVWLRMSGLRHVLDRYSEESYQASHALRLIREFVDKVGALELNPLACWDTRFTTLLRVGKSGLIPLGLIP